MHTGFLSDKLSYHEVSETMKANIRNAIHWDGAHVVNSDTGVIVGVSPLRHRKILTLPKFSLPISPVEVNRKLEAPTCAYQLEGGYGTVKYRVHVVVSGGVEVQQPHNEVAKTCVGPGCQGGSYRSTKDIIPQYRHFGIAGQIGNFGKIAECATQLQISWINFLVLLKN